MRSAIANYLQTDPNLNDHAGIVGGEFSHYLRRRHHRSEWGGDSRYKSGAEWQAGAAAPEFAVLRDAGFRRQLRMLYAPGKVYDVSIGLELDGHEFGGVRVGVSTVFLRNELTPRLQQAAFFSVVASSVLWCWRRWFQISRSVPKSHQPATWTARAQAIVLPDEETSADDEVGLVSLKIAHLGRQIRDTNEIFSALKDNVEQVMTKLQDGLMLFTRDARVVLVSASAEKFLGRPRREILGRTVEEIFSDGTVLGAVVLPAFQKQRPLVQYEFEAADGRRVQVSLDFIQEKGTPIGALLTMRDAESVRRIEDEIEISRRLSASGRLTRGVAHEVKNPINAIVLHLQLLQNKLQQDDPETRRHMDIIGNEIHRLDRVVQILVDFTRPRDLRLEDFDLRKILEDVAVLATPDAARHGVHIVLELPNSDSPNDNHDEALMVHIDSDLMKQAILNLVLNGVQSMKEGTLTLTARRDEEMILAEVRDQGCGIPAEAQEKIFELYYTTKGDQGGSGIGLAQTYQIMQWHYGSVEFDSVVGAGTTFRLRLPAAAAKSDPRAGVELTA
jgi:PAS domain S-box-containing protein